MAAIHSRREALVTLPSDHEIEISREFDAPPALVYRAWTEPELVRRWWSAGRGEPVSIEIDLRVGGTWRYAMTADDGSEVAFHGEYREVIEDARIVTTEVFECRPQVQGLRTVTFAEIAGRTLLTNRVRFESRAVRDLHLELMQGGLNDAIDLFEETVIGLVAERSQGSSR
jgi:uncharacterized protein YndB with AHSA1/START domain